MIGLIILIENIYIRNLYKPNNNRDFFSFSNL